MYDEIIKLIFINVQDSTNIVIRRFEKIHVPSDFIKDDAGLETLDSISMRLQFIGESLKKIEKLNKPFLQQYSETDWTKIINLRDFISHHYDMLNYEIIFDICSNHIPLLKSQVEKIIINLNKIN